MSLDQNKRGGLEFGTIIEALLILITFIVIVTVFKIAASRADEKTQENLCRGFNAIRYGTQELTGLQIGPRACKTIDKKDVPGDDYKEHVDGIKAGAQAEIRDLMARCWWMWLEGNQKNMFEKSWYNIKNGCFICYTFSLDKGVGRISYNDFSASLSEPYYAVDGTDRCASAGQGGWCMDECNSEFPKEVPSNKCNPQISGFLETGERIIEATSTPEETEQGENSDSLQTRKCCISENECESRGGKCFSDPNEEYTIYYKNWKCNSNKGCYIKPEKSASYLDYIQGTKGVQSGAGKVLFFNDGGFQSKQKYAITFISPGREMDWDIFKGPGIAIVTGAGTRALLYFIPYAGQVALAVQLAGAIYGSYETITAGDINDLNYILVSKYDNVKSKCAQEAGVGER